MEIDILNQIMVTLNSIAFGIFLGIVYDVLSFIGLFFGLMNLNEKVKNKMLPRIEEKNVVIKNIIQFIFDIFYFLIASLLISVFAFGVNKGIVRWYIIVGIFIGFMIYKRTIGMLINTINSYIAIIIFRFYDKTRIALKKLLKAFINRVPKRTKKTLGNSNKRVILFAGIKQ